MAEALNLGRVLITGGTGFVGQHLVRRLLAEPGTRVRVLTRSHDRVVEKFDIETGEPEVVVADLIDRGSLTDVCADIDVIFHLASLSPATFEHSSKIEDYELINSRGTRWLCEAAMQHEISCFVYVSSTAAMGTPTSAVVDESTPCTPGDPYGLSKLAAERALLDREQDAHLPVVVLRPCLIAGPGNHGGPLLKMFELCRKGRFPVIGRRLAMHKPLVMVHDFVQALLLAAERGRPGGIYLIHSDGDYTLGDFLTITGRLVGNPRPYLNIPLPVAKLAAHLTTPLAELVGRPPPLSPSRLEMFLADRRIDISKAKQELGFEPGYQDLYDMLACTYDDYLKTGQI